jgi:hypothetical protein
MHCSAMYPPRVRVSKVLSMDRRPLEVHVHMERQCPQALFLAQYP